MDDFLTVTMSKLRSNEYRDITIVIGNESCDLDSAVTSIVYAIFLNWQFNNFKCRACTRHHRDKCDVVTDDIFVPVLNVHRQDFGLKTEVFYYFKELGICEKDLVFRDDYDLKKLLEQSTKSKVVLVDHHVLAKRDEFFAPFVTEIIDHRPLNKSSWCFKDDCRSTIETVGSCSTLVTQRIKDLSKLLSKDDIFFTTYMNCAKMLHATIILDTVNFSKEVNKATPLDEEIILYLESIIKPTDYEADRKRLLDLLVSARSDVSNLNASQLLKKDVKIVDEILVPSFPILVKEFLHRPSAIDAVSAELQQHNCTIALLLGMDLSGGLKRDTAVYSILPEKRDILATFLEDWKNPSLGLEPETIDITECKYYRQNNLSASRKQYMPILSALFNK